jgi:AraC-like DNA-binding protein
MLTSGTSTCSDPGEYQSKFRGARINLVFSRYGEFRARLTWAELRHVHLVCSEESLPRIAYVSLPPERVFVGFSTNSDPPPIWGGMKLGSQEIILHARGDRIHQQTTARSRWGFISLAPERLAAYGRAIAGLDIIAPPASRILRPPPLAKQHLLHLHAQACRLAETKPEIIEHWEVARALEQELLHALIVCLAADDVHDSTDATRRRLSIMARFEEILQRYSDLPRQIRAICAAIGVPDRTLRACCAEVLSMGPSRYSRLQRLSTVRAVLRCAVPATASVTELARRYGFSDPARFTAAYRLVFGETPSAATSAESA